MKIHQDSRDQLKSFQYHKYNSSIFSAKVLDPISQLFLSKLSETFPPNAFTMVGLIAICISYIFSLSYNISSFSFILTTLSLLIYQLSDTLNQKTALRNQSNSISTLLLDHLSDHIVCCLIVLTFCNLLQLSLHLQWLLLPLFGIFPFYLKYINLYYTNKMVLWKINPVDEGVLALQVLCWVSAIVPDIWMEKVIGVMVSHWFVLTVLIIEIGYLIICFLEVEPGEPKFSGHNFAPLFATAYIFLFYYSLNPYILLASPIVRIIQLTFILVHTIIIGRLLIYHGTGEKFKPVSFGYLMLILANIMVNVAVWVMDAKDQIIVGDMLVLIVGVLALSYTVVWVITMGQTLKKIVGSQ